MKTDKGYRFNIAFSDDSAERVRVGAFLQSCGNKKAAVIVDAIASYLDLNPDLSGNPGMSGKISVTVKQTFTREEITAIVRDTLKDMGRAVEPDTRVNSAASGSGSGYDEEFVARMVNNLDEMFG